MINTNFYDNLDEDLVKKNMHYKINDIIIDDEIDDFEYSTVEKK